MGVLKQTDDSRGCSEVQGKIWKVEGPMAVHPIFLKQNKQKSGPVVGRQNETLIEIYCLQYFIIWSTTLCVKSTSRKTNCVAVINSCLSTR